MIRRLGDRIRNAIGSPIYLHIRPEGLSACRYSGRQIRTLARFANTPEAQARFIEFLGEQRSANFILLADTDDETTVPTVIPRVSSGDRQTLIAHKLDAHFPEQPFRACTSLGDLPENRRQEKILLAALGRTAFLAPWLARLDSVGSAVAGVYAPGQLDERIGKAISATRVMSLLVICDERVIRQSLLIHGVRHFSRTSRLPPGNHHDQAFLIDDESKRLLQYLAAQEIIPAGSAPEKTFLAPPDLAQALALLLASDSDQAASARALDYPSVVAACKLGQETPWPQAILTLLARHRPGEQLAPREILATHRDRRLSALLLSLACTALVVTSIFAAWSWQQARWQIQQTDSLHRQSAELQERYAEIAKGFPRAGIEPATLRRLNDDYRALRSQHHAIAELLAPLSEALNETRAIELTRITWQAADPALPGLLVEASLAIASLGYRQADGEFKALLASLGRHAGLAVTVIAPPFEFASDKDFRSDDSAPRPAPFKLRLNQLPPT